MRVSPFNPSVLIGVLSLALTPAFATQTYLVTDLGSLGGLTATAAGINNSNQVAGTSTLSTPAFDAFLYANGQMQDLGNLGGDSSAAALNNLGHVVGYSTTATQVVPFLFRNGTMMNLGVPAGVTTGMANGVNDSDQVVGDFTSGPRRHTITRAFLWQNGVYTDIGTLGENYAVADAINDAGQIVGTSINNSGQADAFLWQDGVMTDLGTLPGGFSSAAFAINSQSQIAGESSTAGFGPEHAVVFRNGTVIDLGVLAGFTTSAATGINDAGIIVGTGTNSGVQHAFLLTPTNAVTEPAAPINLLATSGNATVSLTWTASVGATSYNVKRATSSSGPFTTIASVSATSFTDTMVANCTVYTYVVSAVNSAGESPNSGSVTGDPQGLPAAPGNLTAKPNTQANLFDGSAIVLAWRNNASSSCSELVIIERSTDGVNFQDEFSVGSNQNTVIDGFLNAGTRYFYRVRAESAAGDSANSNIASVVAPPSS
ncbi:MAG TPA: hypothetical protein VMI53_00155 [Opitutaceae bacterium]|nr:hypothetical protein [Opitutaceae bacterium]